MLEEYMVSLGHNEDEINLIKSSYPLNTFTESVLLYKYKNLVNYFHRNGLDNESIRFITKTIPNSIAMSIEDMKDKVNDLSHYSINKMDIFKMIRNYPYVLEMSSIRIHNKYQLFQEFYFTKDEINELLIQKTDILNKDPSSIKKRIQQLIDYGYDKLDIPSMIVTLPQLLDMSINTINKKQLDLKEMGFNKEEIIKTTYYLPNIYEYSKDDILENLKCMTSNGYSTKGMIQIIKKLPIILKKQNIERIEGNINSLKELGFNHPDIIYLTEKNPYILLFSKDALNDNYKLFAKYNYYNAEIIRMIMNTPLLFTYSSKSLIEKLDYYKDNNCLEIIKNNSNYLLISLDIITKRRKYVDNKSIDDLFLLDKEFYNKYKISRNKLLEEN